MADTTDSPNYILPDQRAEVVVLGISRAFDTLLHSWPEIVPNPSALTALASEHCAMFENGQVPIPNLRPLTNDKHLFREIFCEAYVIGYNLACPIFDNGLYRTIMQLPEENRWAIIYGIANGIVTAVPPELRARLMRLSGLPSKQS